MRLTVRARLSGSLSASIRVIEGEDEVGDSDGHEVCVYVCVCVCVCVCMRECLCM